jgi:hypothetical protein
MTRDKALQNSLKNGVLWCCLILFGIVFMPTRSNAEPWSGIIDTSRAIDWSTAGVAGGIPTRTTICQTLGPGATASQINSAIQNCPSGQVVKLNAGIYVIGPISFDGKSNVTLRGAGPDKTIIKSTGAGGCIFPGAICIIGTTSIYGGGPDNIPKTGNVRSWIGGLAKGSTQLTLSNTNGITAGMILVLDQINDLPGADTGGIYQCSDTPGCSTEGGPQGRHDSADGGKHRTQMQFVNVISVDDGTHVTIDPPIYMGNWRASQNPQAWWWGNAASTAQFDGIEDLTIDGTNVGLYYNISISNAYNCWVKNVRGLFSPRAQIGMVQSARIEVRDSYFYKSQNGAATSYGVESFATGTDLIMNNIFHNVTTPTMGPSPGSVIAYNYSIDMTFESNTTWNTMAHFGTHDSGGGMTLYEGNQTNGWIADIPHGNGPLTTLFRNHFRGRDDSTTHPKNQDEIPVVMHAFSRANNVVGNVLGTSGYHLVYEWSNGPQGDKSNKDRSIYVLDSEHSNGIPQDDLVFSSLLRWGNYDAATGTVRWNSSEIPTKGITYVNGNAVPATQTLPNSFFLSKTPSWWPTPWGTQAWPPIGPDVTGGDYPDSGIGGRAYQIPARLCYYNSPIDTANYPGGADRGVLLFNAYACYDLSGGGSTPPNPTNLKVQ